MRFGSNLHDRSGVLGGGGGVEGGGGGTFMSLPLAIMPKTLAQHFCSLYSILRKDVEQDTLSQASMYNILRKDVKQSKLSQASMLLASMPKTPVFTALYT